MELRQLIHTLGNRGMRWPMVTTWHSDVEEQPRRARETAVWGAVSQRRWL